MILALSAGLRSSADISLPALDALGRLFLHLSPVVSLLVSL